ncbi:MAG: hypothetical protein EBR67_03805 [Proteobacteria bacterium]|jgi:hypothetical protein|nr:hypothetical protein [Pseudomonadota bacterium]
MANLLQRIGGPAAVVLAPFIVNAGQVGATEPCFKKPSPTFPGNPQELVNKSNKETVSLPTSSPTNPTPKRDTDIVNLSKPSPFSVTRMPIEVSQVSQREEQPSSQQAQPTTSSAVTQNPTGVTTQRYGNTAAQFFLNSQRRLNNNLIQDADEARRLQNQVPGG